MQLGKVLGHGISTIKHPTLHGWRLLLVEKLDAQGQGDGEPILAVDPQGAKVGDIVILSADGKGTRETVGARDTPARWMILGLCD